MPSPPPPGPGNRTPPSTILEVIIGTCVGATVGLLADNIVLGTAIGIAQGVLLIVLKLRREARKP